MQNRTKWLLSINMSLNHRLYIIQIAHYLSIDYIVYRSLTTYPQVIYYTDPSLTIVFNLQILRCPRAQSTLNWSKPNRFYTERSLYFVKVLRLSCTIRCLGAFRRLVGTHLYVLFSLPWTIRSECQWNGYFVFEKRLLNYELNKIGIFFFPF